MLIQHSIRKQNVTFDSKRLIQTTFLSVLDRNLRNMKFNNQNQLNVREVLLLLWLLVSSFVIYALCHIQNRGSARSHTKNNEVNLGKAHRWPLISPVQARSCP